MKLSSSVVACCISSSENSLNVEVLGILIFANEGVGLRRFPGGGFVESGSKHTDAIVMVPESSNGVLAMLAVSFAGIDAISRDKGKKEKKRWVAGGGDESLYRCRFSLW